MPEPRAWRGASRAALARRVPASTAVRNRAYRPGGRPPRRESVCRDWTVTATCRDGAVRSAVTTALAEADAGLSALARRFGTAAVERALAALRTHVDQGLVQVRADRACPGLEGVPRGNRGGQGRSGAGAGLGERGRLVVLSGPPRRLP